MMDKVLLKNNTLNTITLNQILNKGIETTAVVGFPINLLRRAIGKYQFLIRPGKTSKFESGYNYKFTLIAGAGNFIDVYTDIPVEVI
ncbi:hypothetical protein IX317_001646 [Fusobacterium sp. DD29]|uniref:hypothetical protein n=1 Tax=unclassified Fusobacterium TaxID=2648384 RepID=UPI001B8B4962|nr:MULTISPECIES: hypothetical protein [unclassified Fusobacterium]MBR8749966.1 hypothetical protein [Fusobacterium sp. DD29]MBR8762221.1 hypothetical protein [Fusobacterium sp. DD25]MBR8768225.1 hypothetical protein [Fusobacterium sp. DD43]MBR8772301.1 hypothetical protein [Fusobacterium sp. DD40]MBR8776520.1 hypothetical protein [Fusobacterium sp. DD17]